MNNSPSYITPGKAFLDDTIQLDDHILPEHSEPANFPSTAEVFHAVFENHFHANCIGNGYGKILEANERICKIFGYTEKEMVRLTTKEIFDTTDSNYALYLHERELNGKVECQVTGIRKNGELFACEVSSVIFTNDNGETRTLNTIHDISWKYPGEYSSS